jgi:hypothetical protein
MRLPERPPPEAMWSRLISLNRMPPMTEKENSALQFTDPRLLPTYNLASVIS